MTSLTEQPPTSAPRRADLDWLRLLAFSLLIFFHSAMPFISIGWYIKDTTHSKSMEILVLFLHEFRLPLLFLVAGASLVLASRGLSLTALYASRAKRLLVPFLFGLTVVLPPHAYFEYRHHGNPDPGFLSYWASYLTHGFAGMGEQFDWRHLWFLPYLLVVTLVLLPLVTALRRRAWVERLDRAARHLPVALLLTLPAIPWILNEVFFRGASDEYSLIHDPAGLIQYGLFLLLGAALGVSVGLSDALARARWFAAAMGMVTFLVVLGLYVWLLGQGVHRPEADWRVGTARAVNTWLWIVASFGCARVYLARSTSWLARTNRYVYPCYILHQTVVVALAFYIVTWPVGIWAKYPALVLGTAVITIGLALVTARVPVLAQCLGYWPARKRAVYSAVEKLSAPPDRGRS